jgi:AcrR family transcriptional regulator
MVQKSQQASPPRRGRPRAYDADDALGRAIDAFWDAGFAATSLDDLSHATGMNRPSLYAAFGDKRELYQKALDRYRERAREAFIEAFARDEPLRAALRRVYDIAISIYLSGDAGARGCFIIGTTVTEAVTDVKARAVLADTLAEIDEAFARRIRSAQRSGELPGEANPVMLGKLAAAALYSLAIRARAGAARAELEAIADAAADIIGGPRKAGGKKTPL